MMDRIEAVRNAIMSITKTDIQKYGKSDMPVFVERGDKCSEKQIQNAIAEFAPGCRPEEIAILVDQTVFRNGKKGFLFTEDAFYASKHELLTESLGKSGIPYPLTYDEVESIRLDENIDYLIFNYKDGTRRRVFGNIYSVYLYVALNEVLKAVVQEQSEEPEESATEQTEPEEENAAEADGPDAAETLQQESAAEELPEEAKSEAEIISAALPQPGAGAESSEKPDTESESLPESEAGEQERFAQKMREAKTGDAQAQFELGLMYENGEGTNADLTEALRWYEKAANQDHAQAQCYTGFAYKKGRGTEADLGKGLYWYKKSAMGDYPPAQYNYAMALKRGDTGEADYEEALYWLEEAANQDYAKAQERLAQMYENGEGTDLNEEQRRERARSWYEKAAEHGRMDAQVSYGLMCYKGEGGEQDYETALYWFEQAACQGHARAQYYCAMMYREGEGTEPNQKKAVEWMRRSALQDEKEAQYALGVIYYNGSRGTPRNTARGLFWLTEAASNGSKEAQEARKKVYVDESMRHMGVVHGEELDFSKRNRDPLQEEADRDRNELRHARRKYANKGIAVSQYQYGRMYAHGEAMEKNLEDALYWYEKAAENGHVRAMYACGTCYDEGEGTEKDIQKAFFWYEKAAEAGSGNAQYALAKMYDEGRGVSEDRIQAMRWYKAAMERGIDGAKARYDLLSMDDHPEKKKVLQSKRIMVCDDAAFMRMMYRDMLVKNGLQKPIEVDNARDALLMYEKERPDLVLIKLVLAEINGAELSEQIAENWPDAKIILLYPMGLERTAEQAKQNCGAIIDMLVLPAHKDKIIGAVIRAFEDEF